MWVVSRHVYKIYRSNLALFVCIDWAYKLRTSPTPTKIKTTNYHKPKSYWKLGEKIKKKEEEEEEEEEENNVESWGIYYTNMVRLK